MELHFRFDTGREIVEVSDQSKRLAAYVRQALQGQPLADEAMLRRNRILDEGFLRLREDLEKEFLSQIDELDKEPGCGRAIYYSHTGSEWEVKRTDTPKNVVVIKLDREKRLLSFKCEQPFKMSYFIEVSLTNSETAYYFQAGEKKNDLNSTNEQIVPFIVNKVLYALFNVGV